jgi:hypothetical protein
LAARSFATTRPTLRRSLNGERDEPHDPCWREDETMQLGPFELQPTALVVHGKASFEEWEQAGRHLREFSSGVQW